MAKIQLGKNFTLLQSKTTVKHISMIWVTPSDIIIGSKKSPKDFDIVYPYPLFRTRITHGYWLCNFPTTTSLWDMFNPDNNIGIKNDSYSPIHGINWVEAMRFCYKLNSFFRNRIPTGYHFSLPTEIQWENACKAGKEEQNYFDENNVPNHYLLDIAQIEINNSGGYIYSPSAKVGEKQPNKWGFYDMIGGCGEWCFDVATDYPEDTWDDINIYDWIGNKCPWWALEPSDNPSEYTGRFRICRGAATGAAIRMACGVSMRSQIMSHGFRVALRPITEWDLNDPLLKKEGINILGD